MASIQDIRTNLLNAYNGLVPELDLSEGTEERDIFIEAPIAGCLQSLYANNDYNNKLYAPFRYFSELSNSDLDNYCANYNVYRNAATKSAGIVLCYTYVAPTSDINIDTTKTFSTASTPRYTFKVVDPVYISLADMASYYNGANGRWEFYVSVEAVEAGSIYRAGASLVTKMDSSITGIQGCINESAISGGEDAETNESLVNKLINTFKSRGLYNKYGIAGYIGNFSSVLYVAEAGDPLMQRDNGLGGCIDIYIKKTALESYTETISITEDGLNDTANGSYSKTSITLSKPPVKAITSVYINDAPINISDFSLKQDLTGVMARSTKASDKLVLSSAGSITEFKSGDVVEITYTFNSYLYTLAEALSTTDNTYSQRNYLVREMTEAPIKILADVQPTDSTVEELSATWNSIMATYLDTLPNGATITRATINQKLNEISTIANINLNTLRVVDVNSVGASTDISIALPKNAYPVLDSAIFSAWVAN